MKLLITGCARSGTTLMVHLMQYFYSTHVVIEDEAHPMDFNNYNHKDHVLVIKKPFLEKEHIEYFTLHELLLHGWKIIWLVRDGRDVITSKGNIVPPSRWITSNEHYLSHHANADILLIRYESLVRDTENELRRISKFINQQFQRDWFMFYKNINQSDPMNIDMIQQPIHTEAIGRYKDYDVDHAMNNPNFTHLLNLFGYDNL